MFCGKAFQILGPKFVRLLGPKVVDLWVFTKISFGLTLAFSFVENILSMKLGFRSFIALNVSKAKFQVFLFPSTVFGLDSAVFDSR